MTKTTWIVLGVGLAIGLTALIVYAQSDKQRAKKERDEVLKSLKDTGVVK
jgi:hypothetical protein